MTAPPRSRALPRDVFFVNENVGGHASMHLHLRSALREVAPDVDARFLDASRPGPLRRLFGTAIPGLGALDLDLQPLRHQLAQSEFVRRRLRHAGQYDVLHVYSQSIALRIPDALAAVPSIVATDATFAQSVFHLPYRRPTRFTGSSLAVAQHFEHGVYDAATLVIAQSEWVADSMRFAYGIEADRIRVVPFGIEVGPVPERIAPDDLPEITFVGSSLARKGGARLLRAMRGPLRGRCILNLVTTDPVRSEPGVRVFGDFRPGDPRLPALLARSAMFVFPSEIDNSPYSVLEAMRARLPVVTTRVGALPEMVSDGETGVLVPHDDEALAAAIVALLDEPDRAAAMGDAARARLETVYDARLTTRSLLDVMVAARERHGA
jgi:alpha-maltose-1-phosphate synthase